MQKLNVRLCIIGQPPPDFDIRKITGWKSKLWHISSAPESFLLSENADLDSWGYSDDLLSRIVEPNNNFDFTICLLNVPLEANYFSRRLDSNVVCFTFYEVADILRSHDIPIENGALRMLYSYTLIFKRCSGRIPPTSELVRFAHDEARGCIFDMNGIKTEIALSCDSPSLCPACKSSALQQNVSKECIARYEKEIRKIKKGFYFTLAGGVKRNPILAIIISLIVAFLVNLGSSYYYDIMK